MFTAFFDQPSRYAKWLHPGGPLQWDWELDAMIAILATKQPKTIVEIGSYEGYTLERMALAAPEGATLVSIDPIDRIDRRARTGLRRRSLKVHILTMRSDDPAAIAAAFALDGIDWLLIDGDHTYEAAMRDFETYGPMVQPGGIIALHDIYPSRNDDSIKVCDVWQAIVRAGYVTRELVCERAPVQWGGIGLVYVGA